MRLIYERLSALITYVAGEVRENFGGRFVISKSSRIRTSNSARMVEYKMSFLHDGH